MAGRSREGSASRTDPIPGVFEPVLPEISSESSVGWKSRKSSRGLPDGGQVAAEPPGRLKFRGRRRGHADMPASRSGVCTSDHEFADGTAEDGLLAGSDFLSSQYCARLMQNRDHSSKGLTGDGSFCSADLRQVLEEKREAHSSGDAEPRGKSHRDERTQPSRDTTAQADRQTSGVPAKKMSPLKGLRSRVSRMIRGNKESRAPAPTAANRKTAKTEPEGTRRVSISSFAPGVSRPAQQVREPVRKPSRRASLDSANGKRVPACD